MSMVIGQHIPEQSNLHKVGTMNILRSGLVKKNHLHMARGSEIC